MKTKLLILAALCLPLILGGVTAHNLGQTHLDWRHDGNDINGVPTALLGFTAYCGAQSGNYTVSQYLPDANARHITVAQLGLPDGEWYCTVTAANAVGESAPGVETHFFLVGGVQYTPGVPAAPTDIAIGE